MTGPVVVGLALRDSDADAGALALGRELARFLGTPLALVNAYPDDELPHRNVPSLGAALRERALAQLEQRGHAVGKELAVSVHAVPGASPVRALHDAAEALDAAVLVVASSHRGPVGRTMPGGVGERLLHAAPCAIAIAPRGYAGAAEGIRRIGVAFIDTPDGREALSAGAMLAALGDAELSTLTVLEPPRTAVATPGWVPPPPDDAGPRLRAAEQHVRAQLPEGADATVVVREGDAAVMLVAASSDLDLLVCGSRGYGPVRTVLLGGVSGRLAHAAACPLLVLPRALDREGATA